MKEVEKLAEAWADERESHRRKTRVFGDSPSESDITDAYLAGWRARGDRDAELVEGKFTGASFDRECDSVATYLAKSIRKLDEEKS